MKAMRIICILLALLLGVSCALAAPEDYEGKILDDFQAATIDGGQFTLSESLTAHDLVLVNFWATWCPPCQYEFPFLEEAWKKYSDRVDVIALSVEASDTAEVLQKYAEDNSLTFRIGRDEGNIFFGLGGSAIPTTLIIGPDRKILKVEIGAMDSEAAFAALFDSLLPATGE